MSDGLSSELAGGLCKYKEEIASVCYDKAQISIHPIVHYIDEDGVLKVLSFVGPSGILAHSVPLTFAFLEAMMLELHQTMPLLNIIHCVIACRSSQYRNSSICALIGQAQLNRTRNEGNVRSLFGVLAEPSRRPAKARALRRCRRVNNEQRRQPG